MSASPKPTQTAPVSHPPRPRGKGKLDMRAAHKRVSEQFPRALAELAK